MKYKAGSRRRAAEYERAIVEWWKKHRIFRRSIEERSVDETYVFYDGPPFITGMPHHGTLLSSIVKDAVPRFWTMRGKRVERRWGWDCHGLPAENFVEKQLGITDRREIGTKWSLEEYITKARESMVANSETWEGTIERIGRWVDFRGAYRTMDKDFMESVWWAFKTLYEAGKIYEGAKVLMYDTKFATPVSKSEVTMDNDAYREVTDPSVYVKFKVPAFSSASSSLESPVRGSRTSKSSSLASLDSASNKLEDLRRVLSANDLENIYMLAWTTTPWTLPGNMALAVNAEMEYVAAKIEAPKNNVKAVIFDYAGVVGDGILPDLMTKYPEASEEIRRKFIEEFDFGEFDYQEMCAEIAKVVGATAENIDDELREVSKNAKLNERVLAYILDLRAHGYKIGLLSNMGPAFDLNFAPELQKKYFDDVVLSCKVKMAKPDAKIYELAAERLGVKPENCVFVDDAEVNVTAAEKVGMKGVVFEDAERGKTEIEKCLTAETGEIWILAKSRVEKVLQGADYEIVGEMKGADLVGLAYEPILGLTNETECDIMEGEGTASAKEKAWRVLAGDFVGGEEGTGIVHIAPAYGEDDFELCKANGIQYIDVLDEYGCYKGAAKEWLEEIGVRGNEQGELQIWEVNKFIAKCLEEKGVVAKIEYIKHEYPFNPRSKERIMYRAVPSWFFDVGSSKELMVEQNENINWFPGYLKEGRFRKNIEQAPDWNLSRDRFWATGMPVWKGEKTGAVKVVGSYDELFELSGVRLEDYHRPWVDEVTFDAIVSESGEVLPMSKRAESAARYRVDRFKRVDKVLDCWFESGSMPFAQLHYPFENKEKFERGYPADFIVEYVGQVRAWFYYIHAVNTALAETGSFGKAVSEAPRVPSARRSLNAFKNVITTGTLAGNDGRKMSKSLGNYTDPNELMDKFSADALRFLLLSSPVLSGEDFALTDKDVSDVARKLAMVWNVYDFFCMYAEVDQWDNLNMSSMQPFSSGTRRSSPSLRVSRAACSPVGSAPPEEEVACLTHLTNPLDRWIVARLRELVRGVTEGMEEYNIPKALVGVLPFVDDLSNWFVRRSRRRFWKSEDDKDKGEAYATLYTVMVELAKVLAPFTPFLAEELWQNLVGGWDKERSVHLERWPGDVMGGAEGDAEILAEMRRVREVINEGLALRMRKSEDEEQVKVRQPLGELVYSGEALAEWGEEIVRDEVNVKKVTRGEETRLDKTITEELAREGWARELVRAVQSARKKAGLQVDDRIRLSVEAEVPEEWRGMVMQETLAEVLTRGENYGYDEIVKVNGGNVGVSLEKV